MIFPTMFEAAPRMTAKSTFHQTFTAKQRSTIGCSTICCSFRGTKCGSTDDSHRNHEGDTDGAREGCQRRSLTWWLRRSHSWGQRRSHSWGQRRSHSWGQRKTHRWAREGDKVGTREGDTDDAREGLIDGVRDRDSVGETQLAVM